MIRRLFIALAGVLLLGVLLFAAGWQWLNSAAGNRWLIDRAVAASSGALEIDGASGRLSETLVVERVRWAGDGMQVLAGEIQIQGGVSLWNRELRLGRVSVASLALTPEDSSERPKAPESESTPWDTVLAGLSLPITLIIDRWDLGPVTLAGPAAPPQRLLNAAGGSLRWDEAIALSGLTWDAPDVSGAGAGTLALTPPFEHHVQLDLLTPVLARAPAVRLTLNGSADLTELSAIAEGEDQLRLVGEVANILREPVVDLGLSSERFELTPGVSLEPIVLSLQGPVEALLMNGEGRLITSDSSPVPWSLQASLADSALSVNELRLEAGERPYVASGTLSHQPGELRLEPFFLASEDGLSAIEGVMRYDLESAGLNTNLAWTNLSWPLEGGEDSWRSPAGHLQAEGALATWNGVAELTFLAPGIADVGSLNIVAEGEENVSRFNVTGEGALIQSLEGTGSLDWSVTPRLTWQGAIRGLNLAPLSATWPSAIDAQFNYAQEGNKQELLLESLGGTLRGVSLSGSGQIRGENDRWDVDSLRVDAGSASLSATGAWPREPIDLELRIPIGSAVSRWLGLDGAGRIGLDLSTAPPVIDAELNGNDLELGDLNLQNWSLQGNSAAEGLAFSLNSAVGHADKAARMSGNLRLNPKGGGLQLSLEQGEQTLALAIAADTIDWDELRDLLNAGDEAGDVTGLEVEGRLTEAVLSDEGQPWLTLVAPAPWKYVNGVMTLSDACWRMVEGGGGCLAADLGKRGEIELEGTLDGLPLGAVAARLDSAFVPDQLASGELSFRQVPGELPSGALSLDISVGELRMGETADAALVTGAAKLDLVLEAGRVRTGVLNLPLPDVGSVEANVEASAVRLDGSGRVSGRGRVNVRDLAPLEALIPDLEALSGEAVLELDLSGRLGAPVLDGLVRLEEVSFAVPALGLSVSGLTGEGYARGQGEAVLEADFRVGEGSGRLLGDIDLTPGGGFPFGIRVEGENLRLMNTPDIELDANPAFDLAWSEGSWTIDGSLEVPRLRLTPRATLVGQVNESEDVVIVAGEALPASPPETAVDQRFFGQLELKLGEDITLETKEAEARIGGALDLSWVGSPEPQASGALTIDGELEVFGPVLRIANGNLRFPEVPVSNPVLDLRAERDVFGNTQIRAAGVAIGGTARRPSIEAYTRPYTTRDRAWGLLITGQDFDQGQGINALEVGTYIAPRIYVSYGVSLFDEENVASVRYDFGRGFGIKATSGVRQTGVDLSYTIEQD